jgi:hypothetical protein
MEDGKNDDLMRLDPEVEGIGKTANKRPSHLTADGSKHFEMPENFGSGAIHLFNETST